MPAQKAFNGFKIAGKEFPTRARLTVGGVTQGETLSGKEKRVDS